HSLLEFRRVLFRSRIVRCSQPTAAGPISLVDTAITTSGSIRRHADKTDSLGICNGTADVVRKIFGRSAPTEATADTCTNHDRKLSNEKASIMISFAASSC